MPTAAGERGQQVCLPAASAPAMQQIYEVRLQNVKAAEAQNKFQYNNES